MVAVVEMADVVFHTRIIQMEEVVLLGDLCLSCTPHQPRSHLIQQVRDSWEDFFLNSWEEMGLK